MYRRHSFPLAAIVYLLALSLIGTVKQKWPLILHCLLASLFTGTMMMALAYPKDFQFWFNLSITILLAWITAKK